ncbi:hypothetical protein R3I93_008384 [Phoxinus phoxinus]|uniref:Uncharacterized protein n=1 Tax=Phoxinus phoxinus TaxID=58324 RepID=A0AAN9H9K3_9TELE
MRTQLRDEMKCHFNQVSLQTSGRCVGIGVHSPPSSSAPQSGDGAAEPDLVSEAVHSAEQTFNRLPT